jgi:hypothetical protein
MESTLKARQADDPHDAPAISPDFVPAAWADKVLADITRDAVSIVPESKSSGSAVAAPSVDTTFRPAAVGDIKIEGTKAPSPRWLRRVVMALFALCSAVLAAAWQHYGATAQQMIAGYAPPFVLSALMPAEKTATPEQPNPPAALAATADPAPAQPAPPAAPAETAAVASDSTQLIQSMARDLAAMGAQIEQLKASVAELKANQQPVSPVAARTPEARPPEIKPPAPPPRPRISAALPPPRPAPAALRRPPPAYPPVQATAAPMQLTSPSPLPPPTAVEPGDEPVVRPPMPLR